MAIYAKKLTLMTEDLQPKITMDLTINKSRFKIGWGGQGQRPRSAGGKANIHDRLGAESMKSQMIG
jgi:hypothetical protein